MKSHPVDALAERVLPESALNERGYSRVFGALGQRALPFLCCMWALLAMPADADSCCATKPAPAAEPAALPADSIYQLDSAWTTTDGAPVSLAGLRGRHRIVAMFYASCSYACPMLVADLKKIEARLPAGADVVFTLFSFDPERDTPEALRAFARRQAILKDNWLLLTGAPDHVRELAAVLGIRYRKDADGSIAHSNQITLLDGEGRVVAQLPGLNEDPEPLLNGLRTAHE